MAWKWKTLFLGNSINWRAYENEAEGGDIAHTGNNDELNSLGYFSKKEKQAIQKKANRDDAVTVRCSLSHSLSTVKREGKTKEHPKHKRRRKR